MINSRKGMLDDKIKYPFRVYVRAAFVWDEYNTK